MALPCAKKDRIYTFNDKEYDYNEFRALMYDGLLERVPELTSAAKETLATEEGKAKEIVAQAPPAPAGAIDAMDVDQMSNAASRNKGKNIHGHSKQRIIGDIANAVAFLNSNNLQYDPNTGKGTRVFIAKNESEFERIVSSAAGKKLEVGNAVLMPRVGQDGKVVGFDIYYNLDADALSSVGHEIAHVVLVSEFGQDYKLFAKLANEISQFLSKGQLKYLNEYVEQYENAKVRPEEFLVELTGKISERISNKVVGDYERSVLERLVKLIKDFISKITGGDKYKIETQSDVKDFFEALGMAIATGTKLQEGLAQKAKEKVTEGDVSYTSADGKELSANDIKYSLQNVISAASKSILRGRYSYQYLENDKTFSKLVQDKNITNNKTILDFVGKYVFGHMPDNAFSGSISKTYDDGSVEVLIEGKGGVYYPIRFYANGYVWASTKDAAESMANALNKNALLNNGSVYFALVSGTEDKLLSSTTMANGVIDLFKSITKDKKHFNISDNILRSSIIKAAAHTITDSTGRVFGLDLKFKKTDSIDDIVSKIREKLNPENSNFGSRKTFSSELVNQFVGNIKDTTAEQAFGQLISDFGVVSDWKGYPRGKSKSFRLSKGNVISAISQMLSEPMLKGEQTQKVYAIIEITSNPDGGPAVIAVDSNAHESYPKTIQKANENQSVKLHILQDRPRWSDVMADPKTGKPVTKDRELNLFPTNAGVTSGSLQIIDPSQVKYAKKKKKSDSLRIRMTREALSNAALNQESWKDWYEEHQEVIDDFFGDYSQLFQDILSVTSQAASVKTNVTLALKAFGLYLRGESFNARERGFDKPGFLDGVIKNLNRLRADQELQGQKIRAYKASNDGKVDEAVIDRHISRLLYGVDTPSKQQFDKAQRVLAEVAEELGWTPRQVQAALWAHSIYKSKKTPELYGAYLTRLEQTGKIRTTVGGLASTGTGRYEPLKSYRGRGRFAPISEEQARQQGVDLADIAAVDDSQIKYAKRTKPNPKKTVKAYKLFRVDRKRPGQLFPLFVDADKPVELNTWLDADIGAAAPSTKTGKPQVKSKLGPLAYRPGWHAGDLPLATHIGGKSKQDIKAPDIRPDNQVWAEVEMAADRDWQTEANERGVNKAGKFIPKEAHITDQVPEDGYYRYKTNPNMTGNWIIGGSMKVNRILSDAEVEQINADAGVSDLPRQKPFNPEEYGFEPIGPEVKYSKKKPSGKQWPSEEEIKNSTSESSAEFLTVVRRRLEALGVENREVERERLMNSRNEIPIGDYQSFKEDAEALFAQMTLLNPEMLSKTPVEQVKALVSEIGKIKNETTETYFSALVVNATNDMINSKKLSAKAKRELEGISADVVSNMAHAARARGQANAVLNDIYNDFPLFAFKVKSKAIIQEMNAQLEIQTAGEDGKKASEIVKESQDAIESVIDQSPELKEVIDLADDINAAFNDDAVDDINANKRTPLDSRPSVTAQQLIEQKAKYDEIVDKLEKSLDGMKIKLARFNRLYATEKARREHYAQMIADLQADIKKREALIERLKKSNAKISAQNYVYKKQIEALKDKINDLRDINKLLAANKIISPKRRQRLIKKMLDLAAAGKIRDNDFKAVFAEIIGVPYISTRDEHLIQHMAKAIKFFNDKNMKEMAEMYTRKMNNYLERVSKEPWDAFRIARLITSMFFNSVLSALGTLFNALVGSIMMGGTRFVAATTRFAYLNRTKGGVGATLYGVRRMLQEMPTAVSKGMFNQRAYDNLGTSWNSDQLSRGGDPYEVHLLNGFFDQFDRVIKDPELSNKSAAAIALVGSVMVQVNRFTALMKFIDPVIRHSLATHLQAMDEYIQMREEIGVMVKENKAPQDVMEAWSKRFSLGLFEKIDLMSQTGDFARLRALSQAKSEVKELNARRIKTPPWYVRRRTSEIMRQQKDAETMKVYDRIAADMVMMGEPTGVLGAIWDGAKGLTQLRAKREGEKYHTLRTFMNLFFSTSVLAFGRITASGMNEAVAAIPFVGWMPSQMGLLFNKNKDKFDKEVAGQKFAVSAFSTAIFMLLASHMFEIEDASDDDEEDQNQDGVLYDLFGKRVRIKENPDALVRMTSNAYGTKSKNQGISEGRENHSMQIKVNGEWTDWVSFRLWPQISIMGSMLGRVSDDVNHFYIEPDAGKVAKPTSASQFFTSVPLSALGEMTFATIPKFVNGLKYDSGAAFSRLLISPYAAVIQPSAYRDMIATTKSLEGASKKGEYMPEGFKETSKAILTSVYGVNYLISNDVTDEYGLPIKVIDPWRNWWKLSTDVERRSLEHPEVALRFMYPNTHVAANPKTMRIEKVDKIVSYVTPDGGTAYASVRELEEMYGAKYFSKPVSREIELSKEQQEKSAILNKSIYRMLVMQNYDAIMNEAKYGESVGEIGGVESGEVISYYLDKFLSTSTEFTSLVFSQYAAGLITDEELSEMVNSNKELADGLSKEIKERGPLPKSARTTSPRIDMMYEQILEGVVK